MAKADFSDALGLAVDLENASGRTGKDASAVVRKHAKIAERTMRNKAPKGPTGDLKKSIGIDYIGDGRSVFAAADIGPSAYYGRFVENGTAHMSPQPFVSPTLDEVQPGFVADMEKLGGEALE